jgi:hypothetical protein
MATGIRPAGEFCWINMITPRPAEAQAFFGALLGWTFPEMPGMGHRIQVEGHDIGGMFDQAAPNTPAGTPAYIGVMIQVENCDATNARIVELGGKAMPAFDILESGRMAVCFDPNGAEFDTWQAKKMRGSDVDGARHGAFSWFETLTSDTQRARSSISSFGWTAEDHACGRLHGLQAKRSGGRPDGHPAEMRPVNRTGPSTVDDCDLAARRAAELGGTVTMPPADIPHVGRFCNLVSPQGVAFSLMTYAR